MGSRAENAVGYSAAFVFAVAGIWLVMELFREIRWFAFAVAAGSLIVSLGAWYVTRDNDTTNTGEDSHDREKLRSTSSSPHSGLTGVTRIEPASPPVEEAPAFQAATMKYLRERGREESTAGEAAARVEGSSPAAGTGSQMATSNAD